jgi:hypothetical protein
MVPHPPPDDPEDGRPTMHLLLTLALAGVADLDGDGFDARVDCDDGDPGVYPGADEVPADGLDQNCDGRDLCWRDADGDGVGGDELFTDNDLDCSNASAPTSTVTGECNDDPDLDGAAVGPGFPELCDGRDNDCDGIADRFYDGDAPDLYADTDGDGFGDGDAAVAYCGELDGHVEISGDCDDTRDDVYPGAPDVCSEVDLDCDGEVLEDCDLPGEATPDDCGCRTAPTPWAGALVLLAVARRRRA